MPLPDLAPAALPVRLGQRAYLVDLTDYERSVIPALRDDSDTTARSGEASLSTQGLWFRWTDSFHFGAGQRFYDLDSELAGRSSNRYQYWRSVHVDPWTPHELHMGKRPREVADVQANTVKLHNASSTVFLLDGNRLRYSTDLEYWQDAPIPWGAATIYDLNTGVTALYVATSAGLWRSDLFTGGPTAWTKMLDGDFTMVLPHGGQVFVGKGNALYVVKRKAGTTDGWEIDDGEGGRTANPVVVHPDPAFRWTLRSSGPDGWYVGGQAQPRSELYRIVVDTSDPTRMISTGHVMALPNGERLLFARFYVGVWFLATSRGVRLGLPTGDGIQVQALVPIGPTTDLVADGDEVWAVTYGTPDVPTGSVRFQPSRFTEPGVPAWAPDMGWDAFPTIPPSGIFPNKMAVSRLRGRTVVALAQGILLNRVYNDIKVGWANYSAVKAAFPDYNALFSERSAELTKVWVSSDNCERDGWLETGVINFGMPFPKALHDVTLHTRPLPDGASISVDWRPFGEDAWRSLGVTTATGATEHRFAPHTWPSAQSFELRFNLHTSPWEWVYDTVEATWSSYHDVYLANRTYTDLKLYGGTNLAKGCPVMTDWTLRVTPQVEQSLDQIVLPLVFHTELDGGIDARHKLHQDVHAEFCFLTNLVRRQEIVEFLEGPHLCHVKLTGAKLVPDAHSYERGKFGFYEAILQVSLQVLDACETPAVNPLGGANGHVIDAHLVP